MKVKKKWIRMLALCAIILALPLTGKAVSGKQEVLNYGADCSLQVKVADESQTGQISDRASELLNLQKTGKIEVDLYRVATLKQDGTYDKFTYEMLPAYTDVKVGDKSVQDEANKLLDEDKAEEWSAIAQALAGAVRADAESVVTVTGAAGQGYIEIPKDEEGESVGLYLMFVRQEGRSLADSFVNVQADGEEGIATRVISDHYTYDFSPQLVAFPWMEPDRDGNPQYPWLYAREVNLGQKYESDYRYGDLEITKTLRDYKEGSPVTFVFQVEARDADNHVYYSDVVDILFDGAGTKTAAIAGKIRVGTNVTVTEVYSGAAYELTGEDATQTVNIAPDNTAGDKAQVAFANHYNNSGNDGGSVVNSFEPNEDGTGWTWRQNGTVMTQPDSSAVETPVEPED